MIETIAQISDIHIRKSPSRNEEYEMVFNDLYKSLNEKKPSRIVITGDLLNDFIDLQGEQLTIAANFLKNLSKIAPVRVVRGNHDIRKKNLNRIAPVKAIINVIGDSNIIYYDKTDVFYDKNVAWMVWNHGEKNNNPWKTKNGKIYESLRINDDYVAIDLFHDPINGCRSTTNFEMNNKSYYKLSDFKGDLSMFGDIHKAQFLNKEQTKAYSGSLIAQDFTEGDDAFHGYFLWNISTKTAEAIEIKNRHTGLVNVIINSYCDFDDLDYEIKSSAENIKLRVIWETLPEIKTTDNERKLKQYFQTKYPNIVTIQHKKQFVENNKIDLIDNLTLQNITNPQVQQDVFKEYLSKLGCEENVINDVLKLDTEITSLINLKEDVFGEWNIIKFGGENFMSYEKFDIDWDGCDGIYQIVGQNAVGKTTIFKALSYILYGKTLETENRMKFGDVRYVNNRNNADRCSGYVVIESQGQYYGVKRTTVIEKTKDGQIKGAPTKLDYYLLDSPNDKMDDTNNLMMLNEEVRVKTQKSIEAIIGSYDNFMRVVMTTSDTLNRILSNDMAIFIDSLLFDAGLDVFDKKLNEFKEYQKKMNEKSRVSCNVEQTTIINNNLKAESLLLENEIDEIENTQIPQISDRIKKGNEFIESIYKKMYQIDENIYKLDVNDTNYKISSYNQNISDFNSRITSIDTNVSKLKELYDVDRYNELIEKRDSHKTGEYNYKLEIKKIEQEISNQQHNIEILNGRVVTIKNDILKKEKEIVSLQNSKVCPTCNQIIDKEEHKNHINNKIKEIEELIPGLLSDIKNIEEIEKPAVLKIIEDLNTDKKVIEKTISNNSIKMNEILNEIGELTNDKNDVESRGRLLNEKESILLKMENVKLNIDNLNQKLKQHHDSLLQIEENQKNEKTITAAKEKLKLINIELFDCKELVLAKKTRIAENQIKIKNNELLITEYKIQEYNDMIYNLYKKCVHRDGIPRQMLTTYIIPKINKIMEVLLSTAQFNVWLDDDELRPKLVYNSRPDAIVDCISASGKERTFSSVAIKFALNQINVKSKPSIFLLDEVMGKLDMEGSVDEFIEILQILKKSLKKLLIVEHVHEINPDYIIRVELDENGISHLNID